MLTPTLIVAFFVALLLTFLWSCWWKYSDFFSSDVPERDTEGQFSGIYPANPEPVICSYDLPPSYEEVMKSKNKYPIVIPVRSRNLSGSIR